MRAPHLRLISPGPGAESDDDLAVAVTCLVPGIVPWVGYLLLGRGSPAELALAAVLVGVGLDQLAHHLSLSRHRSQRR